MIQKDFLFSRKGNIGSNYSGGNRVKRQYGFKNS